MKQLELLEKKIAQVIQKTKELEKENSELKAKAKEMKVQNEQLQASVLKENSTVSDLSREKDTIKSSIDELLASIESIELTE